MLHLSLPLLCTLPIAACTSEDEARRTQDRIREAWVVSNIQAVNEQFGTKAQCPDDVDADKGDRLQCTATAADGTSVTVGVVQTDDEGRVRVSTKLLKTRNVEMRLWDRLNVGAPPRPVVVMFECQDLVEMRNGGHFTCKGRSLLIGESTDFTLRATFSDDRGAFTYTVRRS